MRIDSSTVSSSPSALSSGLGGFRSVASSVASVLALFSMVNSGAGEGPLVHSYVTEHGNRTEATVRSSGTGGRGQAGRVLGAAPPLKRRRGDARRRACSSPESGENQLHQFRRYRRSG